MSKSRGRRGRRTDEGDEDGWLMVDGGRRWEMGAAASTGTRPWRGDRAAKKGYVPADPSTSLPQKTGVRGRRVEGKEEKRGEQEERDRGRWPSVGRNTTLDIHTERGGQGRKERRERGEGRYVPRMRHSEDVEGTSGFLDAPRSLPSLSSPKYLLPDLPLPRYLSLSASTAYCVRCKVRRSR